MNYTIKEVEIKNRLLSIDKKTKEAKLLNEKIESMQHMLENPTSSIIVMPQSNNSGKPRTEVIAELMDLKDKFLYMLKEIELDRLRIINEIESLSNEKHKWYLKMRYVYCMSYDSIAKQEYFSKDHVKRVVCRATNYYVTETLKKENEQTSKATS